MSSLRTTTRTLLSSAQQARTILLHPAATPTLTVTPRQSYHATSPLAAYKDDQDRQTLRPRTAEGTRSGTDDEVASKSDAAFNPKKTAPADEKASAAAASNGNPLEASGANQEFSRSQNESEAPADKSGKKVRSSVHGGKKGGKVWPMP